MKKLMVCGFFVTALVMFAGAQTVDEIINKHIAAMGGKEKMMSLKTVKMTAIAIGPGGEFSYTFLKKHLTGIRIDFLINKNWSIVTPKKGWSSAPGQAMPNEVLGDLLKFGQIQLDLQGPFLNYKEKGSKIELAGKEKINGTECYNLKIANKAGDIVNYHVDMKTYRIIKKTFKTFYTIYADYKQNTEGYWFAYTEHPSSGGKRNIAKIETNITVDDKIFEVDEGVF